MIAFIIQFELSLGLDMTSYFLSKPGHFGYDESYEVLDLFKPFIFSNMSLKGGTGVGDAASLLSGEDGNPHPILSFH